LTYLSRILSGAALSALIVASALSQSINPATRPQTSPLSAREKRNLDVALDWWREVVQCRDVELAEKYVAEGYIQHDPNAPTGIENGLVYEHWDEEGLVHQ